MSLKKINYYQPNDFYALSRFQSDFLKHLQKKCKKNQPLVLICIGSDRATGDCLGPLVGQSLMDFPVYSVYGTLQFPVHAKNLDKTMELIYKFHKNPFIIAIDSCLGYADHVGYITLSSHETIQTTRLQTVFYLASFIAKGIQIPKFQVSYPHL